MALQICGVSRRHILAPFIALGLLAGVFAFALADIAPARHRSQKLMLARIKKFRLQAFQQARNHFAQWRGRYYLQMMVFSDINGNSAQGFRGVWFYESGSGHS